MKCSLVPLEKVDACWPAIKEYMEGAAKYTYGRYAADDIYDCIKEYDYNLWVAFDDSGIKGAVVTNFIHYPKKKYLVLVFCGGVKLKEWKDQMLSLLQHWAFDSGCDGIESTGRPGWSKIFENDGHKSLWHVYELPCATTGLGDSDG